MVFLAYDGVYLFMIVLAFKILNKFLEAEELLFKGVLQIRCGIGDVIRCLQEERQRMTADMPIRLLCSQRVGNLQIAFLLREIVSHFVRSYIGGGSAEGKGVCWIFHQCADH